jgi:predicted anti-sigma-YlaC factor YlaD
VNGHDEMLDNVAAYALGVLPAAEMSAVRTHLQTCDECRVEYAAFAPAITAIGYSAEATADQVPGPLLKARIMRTVRAESRRRSVVAWPAYLAAAACICIAAGFAVQNGRLQHELAAAQTQSVAQSSARAAAVSQERIAQAREQRMLADVTAADARRYRFAQGVIVTRGTRVYMAMRGGVQLPAGHVYQAWTMAKGAKTVKPSVTFSVANRSTTMIEIPAVAQSLAVVAVSVEPAGGSAQPTTKPIAVIKLNS